MILPVFGMVSEIIPVFCRKVLFGYVFLAAATAAIAFISMGVWAHHMFAAGMSRTADLFFIVSTFADDLHPHRHQGFQLAGHHVRRTDLALASPMFFCVGFLSMFLIGGLTGIMPLGAALVRLPASRHLLLDRPLPLRPDRRYAFRRLRRHPLLVSQDDRPDAVRAARPLAVLVTLRRLPPHVRARCTSPACWACRGGSTPTTPTEVGPLS